MPTFEQAQAWYQGGDSVHDFDHIRRVYHMAERLGAIEGANMELLRAAVLLHDAQGSAPGQSGRSSHHLASAEFAGSVLASEGWPAESIAAVQHCIRAHRFRGTGEGPETTEARVLFDADKLDVIGAIGVARVIGYCAIRGQPFYAQPSARFLETGEKEPGEAHTAYHEYLFKLRKIKDVLFTAPARALAVERDAYLAEYFKRLGEEIEGLR